ncbi:MAG: UDP-N-acetylmuramate--L-alanine ligase [Clostridia bacterium]|nr:UDP-N-acetylmuramate--L-alanine ligase [Clostridia bacterium]
MKAIDFSCPMESLHIHMVGIGGISMSALAHMLKFFGARVSGSDRCETETTKRLSAAGIEVKIGHSPDNINEPSLVCYTAAIPKDNPELVKAKSLGIPMLERAELLGQLMKLYKFPIAVAGTHGKTTTTSMLSLVLLEASLDPTILVGGELQQIGGNFKIGSKDYLVLEACEYVESFLHFNPFISIITNVEEDHLDYFADISHIISAFESFARLNSPLGCIIVCSDDKNAQTVVQNVKNKIVKYGIFGGNNDFYAENIRLDPCGKTCLSVYAYGKHAVDLELSVHGNHNIQNALAAFAAAWEIGISPEVIKRGLEKFGGTKRRFEELGSFDGITVVDDYAHHPTEIRSTLETAKTLTKGNVWCIFQPHTYSRTKAFLNEFANVLSIADRAIIADIFAAREVYDGTIHSCDLAEITNNALYINDFSAIERYIRANAKPGDLVITMGAGDIYKVGEKLVK